MPKFLNNIDLNKNELQNARVQNLTSAPSSPVTGQIWFDNTIGVKAAYMWDGTTWQKVSGTYANADITAAAAIAYSKLALTNSIVAEDITADAVTTAKILDENVTDAKIASGITFSKLSAPQGDFALNGQKITGLANPSSAQDASTKAYVDAARQGLDVKTSVRAIATTSITLSGEQTIDGVEVVAGERVLVVDQTPASANGIYDVAVGAWSRSSDADTSTKVTTGMFAFVSEGTDNADSGWVLTTNDVITLGTTNLAFTQNSGAGQITAGAGLTKTGNVLDVGGTADRITINSDTVDIASTYVGQASITTLGTIATGTWNGTDVAVADGGTGAGTADGAKTNLGFMTRYAASIGDGAATDYTVTHSLGTRDVVVSVYDNSTYEEVSLNIEKTSTSAVTVRFSSAPSNNAYRVVVIG